MPEPSPELGSVIPFEPGSLDVPGGVPAWGEVVILDHLKATGGVLSNDERVLFGYMLSQDDIHDALAKAGSDAERDVLNDGLAHLQESYPELHEKAMAMRRDLTARLATRSS